MEFFFFKKLLFRTGKQNDVIIVFVCRNSRNKLELLSRKNKKKKNKLRKLVFKYFLFKYFWGFFVRKNKR